jgi:acyl-CoA reductase-like NAD-dependent aldehyde dehydrogenase
MTIERLREATTRTASTNGAAQAELGEFGFLIDGQQHHAQDAVEVRSPYDDALVAIVHRAGPAEIERAIATATQAFETTRKLPGWKRTEVLEKISAGIAARREEFARTIALEAGKPIRTARAEVDRAVFTFKIAAEEARRVYGEIVPLDWLPGNDGRVGHIRRVPRGPVVGISPFNFPLNLVAHKVAPALAAGCPIILRPATQTPVSSFKLAELAIEAGWPAGGIAVVPCKTKDADPLVEDNRIKLLTFTGSPAVGWDLKRRAGQKFVTLELGGNAGNIVHNDADIAYAAERVTFGGFTYAGQSCISVQRVYLHGDVYENFVDELIPRVQKLKIGNPLDEATDVGPLIDKGAADRLGAWLDEAKAGGAEVLTGGEREGNLWQPTVLASVDERMRISCQEAFGPFIDLFRYSDVHEAIRRVNDSEYGLQAGFFTNDWRLAEEAFQEIEVGGLMINDVSTYRIDHMPYGGVKASGFGREGLRYAIEEMTEMRLLTFNHRG